VRGTRFVWQEKNTLTPQNSYSLLFTNTPLFLFSPEFFYQYAGEMND
jgi:hypothetical protein